MLEHTPSQRTGKSSRPTGRYMRCLRYSEFRKTVGEWLSTWFHRYRWHYRWHCGPTCVCDVPPRALCAAQPWKPLTYFESYKNHEVHSRNTQDNFFALTCHLLQLEGASMEVYRLALSDDHLTIIIRYLSRQYESKNIIIGRIQTIPLSFYE